MVDIRMHFRQKVLTEATGRKGFLELLDTIENTLERFRKEVKDAARREKAYNQRAVIEDFLNEMDNFIYLISTTRDSYEYED